MYYILTEVDDVILKNISNDLVWYIHRVVFEGTLNHKPAKQLYIEIENFKIKENL